MKYRQITPKYGVRMFYVGIILLAIGMTLSLYSVPGPSQGSPALALPSFPILEMQWSPIPLILVLSTILMASGWISWRHSVGPILLIAVGLFVVGVVSMALNFVYGPAFKVGDATVYLLPYGTQALLLILSGIEVGFFSMIFSWADYRVQSQRTLRI